MCCPIWQMHLVTSMLASQSNIKVMEIRVHIALGLEELVGQVSALRICTALTKASYREGHEL